MWAIRVVRIDEVHADGNTTAGTSPKSSPSYISKVKMYYTGISNWITVDIVRDVRRTYNLPNYSLTNTEEQKAIDVVMKCKIRITRSLPRALRYN